jgi:HAD superfamily hydrolase (TIGR01509 family)
MTSSCGAFILDMDGTIVDNMAYHTQAWFAFFVELGIEMEQSRLARLMGSHTTPELLRQVLGQHISQAEIAKYSERKEIIYRAVYAPHLRAVEGVEQFLEKARRLGIPLAVATSAGARNIVFTLGGLNLLAYFDAIIGGDDVPQGKRGPQIYLATAEHLAVAPEQCLVFEDSRSGIDAAHRAGMQVVVIATDPQAEVFRVLPSVMDVVADFRMLEPASLVNTRPLPGTLESRGL